MINKLHIQIVDDTLDGLLMSAEQYDDSFTNQFIAEKLQRELSSDYPSMVSVEYIDLFMEDEKNFPGVRRMIKSGEMNLPVVLFNGIPKLYGGVLPTMIKKEVEKIMDSGPVH
jgi:sulfur relay (sulfurtransferase) DsrC/TusE family protein